MGGQRQPERPAGRGAPAGASRSRNRRRVSDELAGELIRSVGPVDGPRLAQRLDDAARLLERDRAPDALRLLRPLARRAPDVAAVRELTGLALYRSARWAEAARHLEAAARLGGSFDQHPALADCWRALGKFAKVEAVWEELRAASPSAAVLAEGRIVAAGARADQGDLAAAIRLLERSPTPRKGGVREHHLRLWYALGDLYERVGDLARAREHFGRVVAADRGLADAVERLAGLGAESPPDGRGSGR